MKEFDLAALGNWLNGWVQPDGAFYGFHNHSVWGDNPMRWADYTCGHSTFSAPYMPGLARMLQKAYDARGAEQLGRMMRYQAASMRPDGEYQHIGFQTGELAKVGLIHNMVPALSLALAAWYAKDWLDEPTRRAAQDSVLRVLTQGSLHYQGGRATEKACCNQDYARIWAKLLVRPAFGDSRFEQEAQEDLDYMVSNYHVTGVPDGESDGTVRALGGQEQFMLEPAEYYGLMIAPLCLGYRLYGKTRWLEAALRLCRHVVRSSFVDDRGQRRVHRAYYSRMDGTWGRLTQPMQVQGNGMTLYGILECAGLTGDRELYDFLDQMDRTMAFYQTERGFLCAATGWDCEADAVPATAWQAHDFMYFAHRLPHTASDFWDRMFCPVQECSVVLTSNCLWMEDGARWTIQDYFSRSVYNLFGRKDRPVFGRDTSWTGEPSVVDESYHWADLPVFVLADGVVAPLRPLRPDVKIYNFSPYEVQGV